MLHGLCLHLASFSTRMGSWCSGGSCVSQVVSPKSPPAASVSLYIVFKCLPCYVSPLLKSACLTMKRLEVPPLARAESQCLILTAQARTKPQCACVCMCLLGTFELSPSALGPDSIWGGDFSPQTPSMAL